MREKTGSHLTMSQIGATIQACHEEYPDTFLAMDEITQFIESYGWTVDWFADQLEISNNIDTMVFDRDWEGSINYSKTEKREMLLRRAAFHVLAVAEFTPERQAQAISA